MGSCKQNKLDLISYLDDNIVIGNYNGNDITVLDVKNIYPALDGVLEYTELEKQKYNKRTNKYTDLGLFRCVEHRPEGSPRQFPCNFIPLKFKQLSAAVAISTNVIMGKKPSFIRQKLCPVKSHYTKEDILRALGVIEPFSWLPMYGEVSLNSLFEDYMWKRDNPGNTGKTKEMCEKYSKTATPIKRRYITDGSVLIWVMTNKKNKAISSKAEDKGIAVYNDDLAYIVSGFFRRNDN